MNNTWELRFVRFVYDPAGYVTANVGPVTLCDGPAQESGVVEGLGVPWCSCSVLTSRKARASTRAPLNLGVALDLFSPLWRHATLRDGVLGLRSPGRRARKVGCRQWSCDGTASSTSCVASHLLPPRASTPRNPGRRAQVLWAQTYYMWQPVDDHPRVALSLAPLTQRR